MEGISPEYITRALSSFVFVLIILGLVVWWVKVKGASVGLSDGIQIRVLSRIQIDSKHKLLVAEVGEERFLVGTSPSGISVTPLDASTSNSDFDNLYKAQIESQVK